MAFGLGNVQPPGKNLLVDLGKSGDGGSQVRGLSQVVDTSLERDGTRLDSFLYL